LKLRPHQQKQQHFNNQPSRLTAWRLFFDAPTARHALSSPASGMINHDAPHQLSGRGSNCVTSQRADRAASFIRAP
jgi:hypothetical protein